MRKKGVFVVLFLLLITSVTGTTLKGSIYNDNLDLESDVLVEVDTTPVQKYLAKDGTYEFELDEGTYIITARKGFVEASEEVNIVSDGVFVFDLFLLPDFTQEEELWQNADETLFEEDQQSEQEDREYEPWRYWAAGIIIVLLLFRLGKMRKKYGPLKKFRKEKKVETKKTIEEHKKEIAKEPGYLEQALDFIKKHDGRITQKQLRKEMMHLSEAKVSLILTELEHKGKIEKVKKGRGNVILLK